MAEEQKAKMVKIKLLSHGTAFGVPGDIVEVPEALSKHLCMERDHHDGYSLKKIRIAKLASESEEESLAESAVDLSEMTQGEAEAMGVQNVVPSDPADIGESNKRAAENKKAKGKK